jgi:regulator of protease activity HflC (stomatin/prohibitin superfamily)
VALGRPTLFTQELADLICERLIAGESQRAISRDKNFPDIVTIWRWRNNMPDFSKQYARAREAQADALADRAVEEALTAEDAGKGRLAYDALRWYAGKMKPGTYGDKVQHANAAGDGDQVTEIVFRVGRESTGPNGIEND